MQGQIGDPETARFGSALRNGFRVLAAKTNDSLPGGLAGQTKFGLQPFQNRSPRKDEFHESRFNYAKTEDNLTVSFPRIRAFRGFLFRGFSAALQGWDFASFGPS